MSDIIGDNVARALRAAQSLLTTLQFLRDEAHQQSSTVRELNIGSWANLIELESALGALDLAKCKRNKGTV